MKIWLGLLMAVGAAGAVELDWGGGTLVLDDVGRLTSFKTSDGVERVLGQSPFCRLDTAAGALLPKAVRATADSLTFDFGDGVTATFALSRGNGFSTWRLTELVGVEPAAVERLAVDLKLQEMPTVGSLAGLAHDDQSALGIFGGTLNVRHMSARGAPGAGDLAGVKHELLPVEDAKEGRYAARFAATSTRETGDGWSYRVISLPKTLDLTGLRELRVWVHGDNQGEVVKFQLRDATGGYRDNYLPIDWDGWREVVVPGQAEKNLDYPKVRSLTIYYNAIPAQATVTTLIDDVRAVVETPNGDEVIALETFEDPTAPVFGGGGLLLRAEATRERDVLPFSFALWAAPLARLGEVLPAAEVALGVPSPRPGGEWGKQSPYAHRSYLFITGFGPNDTEETIGYAERGGFPMILVVGGSWSQSAGHHAINETWFPGGLPQLKATFDRFHEAGYKAGLHFLAPAVYLNDPYVTPKPDPRLVKDDWLELAEPVTAEADFIPTTTAPTAFPAEDGGYTGDGTFIQVDDEIIQYLRRSLEPPYGLAGCRRGALGTVAAAHAKTAPVGHLQRSYGYFLFDLDSTLADEVTQNVANVANAIGADMLYFDGSERLQGDHWYYNGKLQAKYYEKLANPDTFLQGSSYSPYSWHLLNRMASADGHGDLKGYLDERTPAFSSWYAANLMPLDIGWYYLHDPLVTLDQFDYILQRCLGFGATISLQSSPKTLRTHPEAGPVLDLINLYERLRVSDLVEETTREKLRESGREYRLRHDPLRLERTEFGDWTPVPTDTRTLRTTLEPTLDDARLGCQIRVGELVNPGPVYRSEEALTLESFETLAPFAGEADYEKLVFGTDKAGSTSEGVTQQLESIEGGISGRCGKYTATSERADEAGWSVIGKKFEQPLDLSQSAGIGLWLKGDGQGGSFKVQLRQSGNALDHYLKNDFTDWRYFQLARTAGSAYGEIDYTKIDYLLLYYNGLPAGKTITCWVDEIKALPALDVATLSQPVLLLGETRLTLPVTLAAGERLVWFSGEAPEVIGAPGGEPRRTLPELPSIALKGAREVGLELGDSGAAVEVRWVQSGGEVLPLPEAALATPLPKLP